jgi:hypothetical protein
MHVIRRFSSVVEKGTCTHGVIGLNPGEVMCILLSCRRYVVILHHTKNYYTKVLYFMKVSNHTSLYGPVASGASADPTSQVCSSAVLVLPIVEN